MGASALAYDLQFDPGAHRLPSRSASMQSLLPPSPRYPLHRLSQALLPLLYAYAAMLLCITGRWPARRVRR